MKASKRPYNEVSVKHFVGEITSRFEEDIFSGSIPSIKEIFHKMMDRSKYYAKDMEEYVSLVIWAHYRIVEDTKMKVRMDRRRRRLLGS